MSEPNLPIAGGCNCGAVRFEVDAPLSGAIECWCERCQRRSGCASSANARTVPGSFRFVAFDGDPGIRVTAHQFTAYAAPWAVLPDDGLPRHPERAPA